ncbi:MAG: hypothetical protein FJ135_00170 [Deltaproteobacteria bacterium]|nr:hypothetical protein [Deltaproteobacteria bacterium]
MQLKIKALILSLLLACACAGPAPQPSPEKIAAQLQAVPKKSELQEKLLVQGNKSVLASYQDYQVGPEDVLGISFFGLDDLNRDVQINGKGEITMPLVGPVQVNSLSPRKVEEKLTQLYRDGDFIKNPQIMVQVKEYRHQRVMVTGAVAQPGSYEVVGPRTLLEMLGKAGGLNDKAGDVVHVIRAQSAADRTKSLKGSKVESFSPGTETIIVDLRRVLLQGSYDMNLPIKNGDLIHVPHAQSAYVMGAVNKAGSVQVKENLTVTQALALAGGTNPVLASNQISLIRFSDTGQVNIPIHLEGVIKGGETDTVVKPNDIVYVHESGIKRFLFNFKQLLPISPSMPIPVVP